MRKVVIDRTKWLRGDTGEKETCLWSTDYNAGCCLGHVAKQITKLSEGKLDYMSMPQHVYKTNSLLTTFNKEFGVVMDSEFAIKAASINDDEGIAEWLRERKLKALFKKNGIELSFKN